jgi:hypothetical protein
LLEGGREKESQSRLSVNKSFLAKDKQKLLGQKEKRKKKVRAGNVVFSEFISAQTENPN